MLNVSIAQGVSTKVIESLSQEIDGRMKEWVTGDKDYRLGDYTRKTLTGDKNYQFGDLTKRAIASFTKKEEYSFGDITRKLLEQQEDQNDRGKSSTEPDDATSFLAMDDDTKAEFEKWDQAYLASKQNDTSEATVKTEDFKSWDEKYLQASKDKN